MNMINRFRSKMLIMNIIIISLVVVAAFSFIFFITYSNINSEIEAKLNPIPPFSPFGALEVTSNNTQLMNILVDTNGNILETPSIANSDRGLFEEAARIAVKNQSQKEELTIGGRSWRYSVTTLIQVSNENNNGINEIIIDEQDLIANETANYSVVFLDISSYKKTLLDLAVTLLIVGFATLGVVSVASIFFANYAIKPLRKAWQQQKQFVADASHELKTPISIINANYDLLLANSEETIQSQMKWLDYIRIGTDRMTKLTNSLLMLAKFDNPEKILQKTSFDLSQAIQAVIFSMETAMLEKGIKSTVSIPASITVNSDLEALTQVVSILLDNAIKYTDENGQISIALVQSSNQVVFSVRNSGKGIPKQDLPKVFDRFYRADQSRTYENGGHGLGLSIAKTIIDTLGGDIQAQSNEEYTTFTVKLNQ